MKKTILLNSQGASIIQGMILAAVLGGAALMGSKMIQDQKHTQKSAETRDQIETLHSRILSVLQDRFNCTETFSAFQNNAGTSSVRTIYNRIKNSESETGRHAEYEISIAKMVQIEAAEKEGISNKAGMPINNQTQSKIITYMNGNVAIKKMSISNMTGPVAKFTIQYERFNQSSSSRTKAGYGAKTITKTIDIVIQKSLTTPPTFEGCYAVNNIGDEPTSVATPQDGTIGTCDTSGDNGCVLFTAGTKQFAQIFCEDLQTNGLMRWEANLNRCVFNLACGEGRVFAGIDAQGNKICRNIFIQTNMNQFLDDPAVCNLATHPIVKLVQHNGKIKIECKAPCSPAVNGGWSAPGNWSDWDTSTCVSTGNKTKTRFKTCNNPAASCGGSECFGNPVETETLSCSSSTSGGSSGGGPGESCQIERPCSEIRAGVCANVDAGKDSCNNSCGNGTKLQGCEKCVALSCHMNKPIHRICYLDGTSELVEATFSCAEQGGHTQEDSGANQCGNPRLCY